MIKAFNKKTAGIILTVLLSALILFHLLVIFRVLPYDIVWGGNANKNSVVAIELFSILLTSIFLAIGLAKTGFLKSDLLNKISSIGIWAMIIYFSFNIIGNLMAKTLLEKIIFIPMTIILLLCSIRLSLKP